jgi:membrane protein implicated in regulation of membrane protease activity
MIISSSTLWLILVITFLIAEGVSLNLVTIWFAMGSLAALIMSLIGFSPLIQLFTAVAASGLSLLLLRPFTKRFFRPKADTNSDRLIGQEGVVIVKIDALAGSGQVKVNGQIWSAKSRSPEEVIERDLKVIVQAIEGVKLIVTVSGDN